jgi:hypothetical protein
VKIARSAAFRLTIRFAAAFVACLLLADLSIGLGVRWPLAPGLRL